MITGYSAAGRDVQLLIFIGSLLGLHGFFTADDVTSIDAPADLIHSDSQTANTTLINLSLLHTLFCHFFY